MTATRKRTRRPHSGTATPQPQQQPQRGPGGGKEAKPLAEWRWRTFPVYFAFSLGAFIAAYLGVAAGSVEHRTQVPVLILFITVALLLGFGFSRLTTRWLLTRKFAKNRKS